MALEDRRQATLLPDCLEDYVSEDNPVRVIEAFIDELDLGGLGFEAQSLCWPGEQSRGDCTLSRKPQRHRAPHRPWAFWVRQIGSDGTRLRGRREQETDASRCPLRRCHGGPMPPLEKIETQVSCDFKGGRIPEA
jgi:hypothetical protein